MVEFEEASIEELKTIIRPHRGRVSYPTLKLFVESGLYCAKIKNIKSISAKATPATLTNLLNLYAKKHGIPVRVRTHASTVYLIRLDMDKDGNKIEDWSHDIDAFEPEVPRETKPLTEEHIKARSKGIYD